MRDTDSAPEKMTRVQGVVFYELWAREVFACDIEDFMDEMYVIASFRVES